MVMNVDVVFTLTGDIRWNSRALKQLRLLSGMGYQVYAIGIADKSTGVQQGDGITIRTLKRPAGSGPRFFKQVHELMKEAVKEVPASIYHASDLYTLPAQASAAKQNKGKLVYDARGVVSACGFHNGEALDSVVLEGFRMAVQPSGPSGQYGEPKYC